MILCTKCYQIKTSEDWPVERHAQFIFDGQSICRSHMDLILMAHKKAMESLK